MTSPGSLPPYADAVQIVRDHCASLGFEPLEPTRVAGYSVYSAPGVVVYISHQESPTGAGPIVSVARQTDPADTVMAYSFSFFDGNPAPLARRPVLLWEHSRGEVTPANGYARDFLKHRDRELARAEEEHAEATRESRGWWARVTGK